MSRIKQLFRMRAEVVRGKKLDPTSAPVTLYPRTRVDTMFNFTLEGRANNVVFFAVMHLRRPLPYEPMNTFVALLAADGGGTFLDIGANYGYFSLLAACNASAPIMVYAFEPSPEEYSYLVGNIALNGKEGQIRADNIGLGDIDGKGELSSHGTGSSFMRGWDKGKSDVRGTQTVTIKPLDTVIRDWNFRGPIVAKVDVEGYELHVLRGGEAFFTSSEVACVLIEATHKQFAGRHNPDAIPAIQLLEEYGFTCYGIKHRIPAIRDTEPDPSTNGLVLRSEIPTATNSPEAWPTSWVCLRPTHPLSRRILNALDMYPLFLATYRLTEDAFEQLLGRMKG